jgi:hypothetical protein
VLVVHETDEDECIETKGETVSDEVVRHVPIRKRLPAIHRDTPKSLFELAKWASL